MRLRWCLGCSSDDGIIVVWKLVPSVFSVNGGRESADVDGFSDASSVVVFLPCKNGEVSMAEVVLVLCCVLHDGGFKVAATLSRRREVFFASFLNGALGFADITSGTRNAVGSRAPDVIDDAGGFGFL